MADTVENFIPDGSFAFEYGGPMRNPNPGERIMVYADELDGKVYATKAKGRVLVGELIAICPPVAWVFIKGTGRD